MLKRKFLLLPLIFSLAAPPAQGEEDTKSAATSALQSVQGALTTANQGLTAIQFSQTQMQAMVNQFAALQGQNSNLGNAQSQFDQVKQQLAVALAEAQQCVQGAKKDLSKYKKGTIEPGNLLTVDPTCQNYGHVIDSVKKNIDQMHETKKKVACIRDLQNKVNTIANTAKKPFGDLTEAAGQVWNTRQGIIDTHQGIVDRLNRDLTGENGFREQLRKLKELEAKVRNALHAGTVEGQNGGKGIAQSIKDLKRRRVAAANSWYYNLMGEVESCFAQDTTQSCSFGTAAAPADCIRAYLGQSPSGSAAQKAQAKANVDMLDQAFRLNAGIIRRTDNLSKIDVNNPDAFLAHVDKRFKEKLSAVSTTFGRMGLVGNANKAELQSFVQQKYRDCYSAAVERFQADLNSEGGTYKSAVNAVDDEEAALNNQIRNLIDEAQQSMNGFRTVFNKVYNRDLSQFSSDCTAAESPYASADCLAKLQVTMKGGIEGTRQYSKLQDGSQAIFNPGPTTLNLQTLTLDQQGQATLSNNQTQCVGFDECINVLDRYQAHHGDQVEAQKKQRDDFVKQHNSTVKAAMGLVAAQFTEISKMMVAAATGIQQDLAKSGVDASVETKDIAGEDLVANEKTGLYDMPSDMRAALAGHGTFTELGDVGSAISSMDSRLSELARKATEAFKMKSACAIKKGDFDSIANRLTAADCDAEKICSPQKLGGIIRPLESLMRKSQGKVEGSEKDTINRDFSNCSRGAIARQRRVDNDLDIKTKIAGIEDTTKADALERELTKKKQRDEQEAKDDLQNCGRDAVASLEALAADSRASMKDTNDKIMASIRKIADSCPEDKEAAAEACNAARKTVNKASPPDNEGETNISSSGSDDSKLSNPLSKGAQ